MNDSLGTARPATSIDPERQPSARMRTDRSVDPAIESRFRDLYSQTLPAVFGFLSLRVGGDQALAEDLTAETYAAAVVRFREGGGDDVDLSWLRTVAKRRLIDHWRRMSVARRNAVRLAGTAQSPATTSELRDCVVAALAGLSEQQRTALLLQHVDGYTVAEIAEILGRSEKATESLLTRARSGFRAFYTEVDHG